MTRPLIQIFRQTYLHWRNHNPADAAAALSFYAIFSLAPLLLILIFIVSIFFGQDIVEGNLFAHAGQIIGPNSTEFIRSLLAGSLKSDGGLVATIVGAITIIIASLGVVSALKGTLDNMWNTVREKHTGHWWSRVVNRFFERLGGFTLIPFLVILVIVSIIGSIILQSLSPYDVSGEAALSILKVLDQVLSFLLTTSLFAVVYRVLPKKKLPWSELFLGGVVTSVLFIIGESLISIYLADIKNTSVFGGAGSLVAIMLFIYYSAQIFFFGAAFTYVYSKKHGYLKNAD